MQGQAENVLLQECFELAQGALSGDRKVPDRVVFSWSLFLYSAREVQTSFLLTLRLCVINDLLTQAKLGDEILDIASKLCF